jgi:hypothetical protein
MFTRFVKMLLPMILFALAANTVQGADAIKIENHSYPVGQKSLTGLESGTITQGIAIRVIKNGQAAANELVRFHLAHSAGPNAKLDPLEVRTDKDGFARTSLRIGDQPGDYIVEAFYNAKFDVTPVEIKVKGAARRLALFSRAGSLRGYGDLSVRHGYQL